MGVTLANALFAIVDVETTGVDPAVDRVVEIACVRMRAGQQVDAFSSLVNPGRGIPAVASAIHHIVDGHVRNAPSLGDLQARIAALCADAVVVAHNAGFDLRFLPFLAPRPILCSLRLAKRVIPDAPSYRNQVLRYHLDVDAGAAGDIAAHRALADAAVTSRILDVCLRSYLARGGRDDVDHLIQEIAAPRLLPALPFGRYRGVEIGAIPDDYLRWLCDRSRSASADARYSAQTELRRRKPRFVDPRSQSFTEADAARRYR